MRVYHCVHCSKHIDFADIKATSTPKQKAFLDQFRAEYPERFAIGSCPHCRHPVCEYPDIFQPADTSVPAEASMASFNPLSLEQDQMHVFGYLRDLHQKDKLGAAIYQMMAALGHTYASVTKALSVLTRHGVVARTLIRVKNPATGRKNSIYAPCPAVWQARRDGLYAEEFAAIHALNLDLKNRQKAVIALEEQRNERLDQLRRRCYLAYTVRLGEAASGEGN